MKPSRDISGLLEIMAALRTPQTGCPWDLEQNFTTIAPYTIEEAYEVADAIARGDLADLRDELGDLLLQVVFHARMAQEQGAFAFGDVVEAITEKLARRAPECFRRRRRAAPGGGKGAGGADQARRKGEQGFEERHRRSGRCPRRGTGRPARNDPGPQASVQGRSGRLRLERPTSGAREDSRRNRGDRHGAYAWGSRRRRTGGRGPVVRRRQSCPSPRPGRRKPAAQHQPKI